MFDTSKRQYIFKDSTGNIFNYFYSDKYGICRSMLTKKNIWSEPESILKSCYPEFFIHLDKKDDCHIICQDMKANMLYLYTQNRTWHKLHILGSKSGVPESRYPYLIQTSDAVNFFYVLPHKTNMLLAHQTVSGNGPVAQPKIIDYIKPNIVPYSVVSDGNDNLYAFYLSSGNNNMHMGYKTYLREQDSWSSFISVTEGESDHDSPQALTDRSGNIHLTYRKKSHGYVEIAYMRKPYDQEFKNEEKIVFSSSLSFFYPCIFMIKNTLIIYWMKNNIIYHSCSSDGGISWSEPSEYSFNASNRPMHPVIYETNYKSELGMLSAKDIPCIFIDGFKLAFVSDIFSENSRSVSSYEFNAVLDDLSQKISVLENKYIDISSKIKRIYSAASYLQKELTKNSIRIDMIEDKLKSGTIKKEPST